MRFSPPPGRTHSAVGSGGGVWPPGSYRPIEKLTVRMALARPVKSVRSVEDGGLKFTLEDASPAHRAMGYPHAAVFTTKLGLNDIILFE